MAERYHELIHQALRENILTKRLPAGLVVAEADVARFFDAGRSPVRTALHRLCDEGLLRRARPSGFQVIFENQDAASFRASLSDTDAVIPGHAMERLQFRNQRERLYPDMERDVASALSQGCFSMTEQDVAAYFGVSRTVVRELFNRLNRVGLIEQNRNGRWFAGPLTRDKIRHHYEMRILLEPEALKQAASVIAQSDIKAKLSNLTEALSDPSAVNPQQILSVESDLHIDLVHACPNPEMTRSIYRNQLPLINVHYTFAAVPNVTGIRGISDQHGAIYKALLKGNKDEAASLLRAHLTYGLATTLERFDVFSRYPQKPIPRYMKPTQPE